ncbi:MAG: dethiobiotin synthase [Pseudomonadota bacterium]
MTLRRPDPDDLSPALCQSLFVAGTDTAVGKTWVATRLLNAWVAAGYRAAGMKPVAAGADLTPDGLRNEDALALLAAGNVPMPYGRCNPVCLPRPTSPHLAAREAGIDIDIELIAREYRTIVSETDVILVEGAGGWFAPITETTSTMADIAQALGLPVLLVVGIRLGALSHALLTAEAIVHSGLPFAGWIANPIDPRFPDGAAYVDCLERRLPAPRLVIAETRLRSVPATG